MREDLGAAARPQQELDMMHEGKVLLVIGASFVGHCSAYRVLLVSCFLQPHPLSIGLGILPKGQEQGRATKQPLLRILFQYLPSLEVRSARNQSTPHMLHADASKPSCSQQSPCCPVSC